MDGADVAGIIPSEVNEPLSAPLQGTHLVVAQVIWGLFAVVALSFFVISLPLRFEQLNAVDGWGLNVERAVALRSVGISVLARATYFVTVESIVFLTFFSIAFLIFWKKSNDWVAILASILFISYGITETSLTSPLDHGFIWTQLSNFLQATGEALSLTIFFVFPNGRFVPRWTRSLALSYSGLVLLWFLFPDLPFNAVYGETYNKTPVLSVLISLLWHSTGLYALIYRYRHAHSYVLRQQMKWVVFGLIAAFFITSVRYSVGAIVRELELFHAPLPFVIYGMILQPAQWLLITVVPICFFFAILRYHLWKIDLIINRTLVYTTLAALTMGIYILIVGSLTALLHSNNYDALLSSLGIGFVAALLLPLRNWLQRRVNRLLYGESESPYTVLARLVKQLSVTVESENVLPTIVKATADSLKLPYVAIAMATNDESTNQQSLDPDSSFNIITSYGTPNDNFKQFPLRHQEKVVGQLLVTPRFIENTFTPKESQLLTDIATHSGVAVYSVQLIEKLRRANEQIVIAREEERRRLHNDLHDGLGTQLASQKLTLAAALKTLYKNPKAAEALIKDAAEMGQVASKDIRRLINNLQPSILNKLGLIGAIQDQVNGYRASGMQFVIEAPDRLPELPVAIEVACYRIVQEALTNVVRHANAKTCTIRLDINNSLLLEILDDGLGRIDNRHSGLGLASMRMRAEELGGMFQMTSTTSGTRVYVKIPLG